MMISGRLTRGREAKTCSAGQPPYSAGHASWLRSCPPLAALLPAPQLRQLGEVAAMRRASSRVSLLVAERRCSAPRCPQLGDKRKSLALARNDVNKPKSPSAAPHLWSANSPRSAARTLSRSRNSRVPALSRTMNWPPQRFIDPFQCRPPILPASWVLRDFDLP